MKTPFKERIFAVGTYFLFVPTLYIILSRNRSNKYLSFHAAQALFFYLTNLGSFLLLRYTAFYLAPQSASPIFVRASIYLSVFLWSLCMLYGLTVLVNKSAKVPFFSKIARALI